MWHGDHALVLNFEKIIAPGLRSAGASSMTFRPRRADRIEAPNGCAHSNECPRTFPVRGWIGCTAARAYRARARDHHRPGCDRPIHVSERSRRAAAWIRGAGVVRAECDGFPAS